MITNILPQGASASDMDSLKTMVDMSLKSDTKPASLLTDAGYGSDANVCYSAEKKIEQIAPTTGKKKDQLGLEECHLDEFNRILICPAGKRPMKSRFENGKGHALFYKNECENCPMKKNCPSQKYGKSNYRWEYDSVKLRLRARRLHEKTPDFKSGYRLRGGIEALNGNLKQNTPLRRLRCRGRSAVHTAIYTIAVMHNIMRFAAYCRKTGKKFTETGASAFFCLFIKYFSAFKRFLMNVFEVPGSFSATERLIQFSRLP